jgi:hypothetical protein
MGAAWSAAIEYAEARNANHLRDYLITVRCQGLRRGTPWAVLAGASPQPLGGRLSGRSATCGRAGTSSRPPCTRRRCGQTAPLDAFSAPGGRNLSTRPGRWPGWITFAFWPRTLPCPQQGQRSRAALSNSPTGAGQPCAWQCATRCPRPRVRAASARAHSHGIHDTITRPAPTRGRSRTPAGNTTRQAGPRPRHDKHLPVRVPACRFADVDRSPGSGCLGMRRQARRTPIPICRRAVGGAPGWESSPGVRRSFPRARGARRRGARQDGAKDRSRCWPSGTAGTRQAGAGAARTGGAAADAAASAAASAAAVAAGTPAAAAAVAAAGAGTGAGASTAPGAAPGAAAGGVAGSARRVRLLPHRRAGPVPAHGPRLSRRCTAAARSCCHHDGAPSLPVGDWLGRCRPMAAELHARHHSAEERVRLARTPGRARLAPGARPHSLIGGVQGFHPGAGQPPQGRPGCRGDPPVRFPGCGPARGGRCGRRHCPEARWDPAGLAGRTGSRAAVARYRAPGPARRLRAWPELTPQRHTRAHALPAAPRPAPGMTHDRNGG